jgi:hypothetical protein
MRQARLSVRVAAMPKTTTSPAPHPSEEFFEPENERLRLYEG